MLYVELVKNDSATTINRAEYELQYVHRDAAKKYRIVPVQQFEHDTTLIAEKTARASIREFAYDSRKLFMEHNLNISERPWIDSVYVIVVDSASLDSLSSPVLKFYEGGEFHDREIAEQALSEIKAQHPNINAVLVRRKKN